MQESKSCAFPTWRHRFIDPPLIPLRITRTDLSRLQSATVWSPDSLYGAVRETWTLDLTIKSRMLYLLGYNRIWCWRRGSNSHGNHHGFLRSDCLPIPSRQHYGADTRNRTEKKWCLRPPRLPVAPYQQVGAKCGIRTRAFSLEGWRATANTNSACED